MNTANIVQWSFINIFMVLRFDKLASTVHKNFLPARIGHKYSMIFHLYSYGFLCIKIYLICRRTSIMWCTFEIKIKLCWILSKPPERNQTFHFQTAEIECFRLYMMGYINTEQVKESNAHLSSIIFIPK